MEDMEPRRHHKRFCTQCGLISYQDTCFYCGGTTVPYIGQVRGETANSDKQILKYKEVKELTSNEIVFSIFINVFIFIIYNAFFIFILIKPLFYALVAILEKKPINSLLAIYFYIAILTVHIFIILKYFVFKSLKAKKIKRKGKLIEGTILGYKNDTLGDAKNNSFQILQIEVNTPELQGILSSHTNNIFRAYETGEKVQIMILGSKYLILNRKVRFSRPEPHYHYGVAIDDVSRESLRIIPCMSLHMDKKIKKKNYFIFMFCFLIVLFLTNLDFKTFTFRRTPELMIFFIIVFVIFFVITIILDHYRNKKINLVLNRGTYVDGVIVGYTDSNYAISNDYLPALKIRIETPDGPRCIIYALTSNEKTYEINKRVRLLKYEDYYIIR